MQPQQPYAPQPGPQYQQYPPAPAPMPGAYPAQPMQTYPQPGYGGPNPAGADQFGAPGAVGQIRPRIKDMGMNALVLIKPIDIKRNLPNNLQPGQTQDRLTADVIVLESGGSNPNPTLIQYGGEPEQGKPHTLQNVCPFEVQSMWITQTLLIAQCERSIGGMVLGRLARGDAAQPGRQAPWKLIDPTEADKVIARQYLAGAAVASATPAPVPQQTPAAQPQTQYVPSQGIGQQFPHLPPTAPAEGTYAYHNGGGPEYAATPAAAAAAYIGNPNPAAQYAPAPGMPVGQQPMMAQHTPGPVDAPPPGVDPNWWLTLTPEQRAGFMASQQQRPPWQ